MFQYVCIECNQACSIEVKDIHRYVPSCPECYEEASKKFEEWANSPLEDTHTKTKSKS
jgi:CxxC motif-containing protein